MNLVSFSSSGKFSFLFILATEKFEITHTRGSICDRPHALSQAGLFGVRTGFLTRRLLQLFPVAGKYSHIISVKIFLHTHYFVYELINTRVL